MLERFQFILPGSASAETIQPPEPYVRQSGIAVLARWIAILGGVISILIGSLTATHAAQSVTLAWDPNSEPDIAGYNVYYGTSSGAYPQSSDVGNTTSATFSNLTAGQTFFFVVTAYNTAGLESPYSNQVSFASTATPPANQPPTVSLSSNGTSFTAPASITLSASASDSGGSISRVEFYNGAIVLGTDTASPYTFTWSGVAAGSYSLTARAFDNQGASTTSAPISVTVTNSGGSNSGGSNPPPTSGSTTPAYVQGNYAVPQTPQATVTLPYTAAQTAGNLNVVIVGWNDDVAQVTSVTDKAGNSYQLAKGPTVPTGVLASSSGAVSQSIYYAANIKAAAAGANVVTVNFTPSADFPDIRVLEYSGIDPTIPLDAVVGAAGNNAASNSGAVTTTGGTDLLVGANTVRKYTTGRDPGFTQRLLTNPDGDIAQDCVVTAAGSYSAGASLSGSGEWVAQLVAFNSASTPDQAPVVSLISPANGMNFAAPATITLNASATDGDGSISRVEFYNGATLLGADTASPYTYTWNAVAAGSYSLTARAFDNQGASTTTAPFSVTVTSSGTSNPPPTSTPAYVQGNYAVPQTPQTTVTLPYAAAQSAGNLNVVIVGWNDTIAQIASVTDKNGNLYQLATGPTVPAGVLLLSGALSQSIYYAADIKAAPAGNNTVTVTFTQAATFADIRVLEYSGIDPDNPLDVVVGAGGNSATSSSGSVTTTNAVDLLVGANTVQTVTNGPGTSFTQRLLTSPDGDIVQDRVVTMTGSYSAGASLSDNRGWVMQMAAFRAANSP